MSLFIYTAITSGGLCFFVCGFCVPASPATWHLSCTEERRDGYGTILGAELGDAAAALAGSRRVISILVA
jgi:hypothetical protein